MNAVTNKQLEKAILMIEILKKFEETELSVRDFCKQEGIHTSKLYYWKDRYNHHGKKGLMDKRKGTPYKVRETVKHYIHQLKIKEPLKSASDISQLIEKRYNKKVSDGVVKFYVGIFARPLKCSNLYEE